MKWLLALLFTGIFFAALADDQARPALQPLAAQPANPKIAIINGRKFYSLQNVRRFTNNGPPLNDVMHHPRQQGVIVTRGTNSTLANGPVKPDDLPPMPSQSTTTKTGTTASPEDVLSVFAPDEKAPSPPPTK